MEQLKQAGEKLVQQLELIAKDLDEHHSNVAIARVAGGTGGAVGGLMSFGLCLAPFTGGTSAVAAGAIGAVGAVLSLCGGLTSAGGQTAEELIIRSSLKKAERMLKEFVEKVKRHYDSSVDQYETEVQKILLRFILHVASAFQFQQLAANVLAAASTAASTTVSKVAVRETSSAALRTTTTGVTRTVQAGSASGHSATQAAIGTVTKTASRQVTRTGACTRTCAATTSTQTAASTAGSVAKGLAGVSIVLNVAGLGLSTYDIYAGAKELKTKSPSKAAELIRSSMITIVRDFLRELNKILGEDTLAFKLMVVKAKMNGLM